MPVHLTAQADTADQRHRRGSAWLSLLLLVPALLLAPSAISPSFPIELQLPGWVVRGYRRPDCGALAYGWNKWTNIVVVVNDSRPPGAPQHDSYALRIGDWAYCLEWLRQPRRD